MRLVVEIDLGTDVMKTAYQAGDAINRALLTGAASMLQPLQLGETGVVLDGAGVAVGRWLVTEGSR